MKSQSGQAMVEYAVIMFFGFMVVLFDLNGMFVSELIPERSVIIALIRAFQNYIDSFYMILALPIP